MFSLILIFFNKCQDKWGDYNEICKNEPMRAKYQFIILQFLEKTAKMTLVTLSFQHGRNFPKKHKKWSTDYQQLNICQIIVSKYPLQSSLIKLYIAF